MGFAITAGDAPPAWARILSVPLPESERRFGDVVLHDGEPRGTRAFGDTQITVFDELLLLARSPYGTWSVQATCRTPEERDALVALYRDVDGEIEDWTESIRMLCVQCSLGEPSGEHGERETPWQTTRRFGLALRSERERERLRRSGPWWRRSVRDVTRVL